MKNKLLNEIHKEFHNNTHKKIKELQKKENSLGKICFGKKFKIPKYFFNKNLKILIHKKTVKKEKISTSYKKIKNFPLINLQTEKLDKRNLFPINSSSTYDIQNDTGHDKERIIMDLFSLKNDINEKNVKLTMLKNSYSTLQDNNLTNKIIMEKILDIENDDNFKNDSKNEIKTYRKETKSERKSLGDTKIRFLKSQIIDYEKTIRKQKSILNSTKKNKRIISFVNINKLINEKNEKLEKLKINSENLQ